jgi:hypothetical protein
MQDSAAQVRKERERWQRWRGELAGSDALTEHLTGHADEIGKDTENSKQPGSGVEVTRCTSAI